MASLAVPSVGTTKPTEYFDVLNEIGAKTGIVKARNHVHRDGMLLHMLLQLKPRPVAKQQSSTAVSTPCLLSQRFFQVQVCLAGDWHRAVHVWIFVQSTANVLIQKRAACKESWPNLWDISAAGHGMPLPWSTMHKCSPDQHEP